MMFRYGFALLNILVLLHYELTNGGGALLLMHQSIAVGYVS